MSYAINDGPEPRRDKVSVDHNKIILSRSLLSVPVNNPRFVEKAFLSDADIIMLDLEDSINSLQKDSARIQLLRALEQIDQAERPIVAVRVNAPSSIAHKHDIACLLAAARKPELVIVPKVESALDLDAITRQLAGYTAIDAMIESPRALLDLPRIIGGVSSLKGIHLGPGDFAAAMGMRVETIGGDAQDYRLAVSGKDGQRAFHPLDIFQPVQFQMVLSARAFGIRVMDGPYATLRDADGLATASLRAAALGMDGKWAIHPEQIATINRAFTPSESSVREAHRILEALGEGSSGAAQLNGRMIDEASVRHAKMIIGKAEKIRQRGQRI
jgi:malyl-CoA/(S)-citramalyl-CoA lyase